MRIIQKNIDLPEKDMLIPVPLSDETMQLRKQATLEEMELRNLDHIVVYADVEHGSNFEYFVGFFPRFEEGLFILSKTGEAFLILGNENYNKAPKSRIEAKGILCSEFSLPNQPNVSGNKLINCLEKTNIKETDQVGLVGWKLFTKKEGYDKHYFDLPYFIVDSLREIVGFDGLTNVTDMLIGNNGNRTINNANEIAFLEYGASLASDAITDAMNNIEVGMTELQLGDYLGKDGQHHSVVTIAASGERYIDANMYPSAKKLAIGDTIALTVGFRGGLSSRSGYLVKSQDQLPQGKEDYLDRVAKPYFRAYKTWLESLEIGMKGKEIHNIIENVFPRKEYGWYLCPGHLTATEEWMSSPIYENSEEIIKSGMVFQVDIIPSVDGYAGVSAESTIVLADEALKKEIRENYPNMWQRMESRRDFIKNEIGIALSDDILPMCNTVAYLRPFLLNKGYCLAVSK